MEDSSRAGGVKLCALRLVRAESTPLSDARLYVGQHLPESCNLSAVQLRCTAEKATDPGTSAIGQQRGSHRADALPRVPSSMANAYIADAARSNLPAHTVPP